MQSISGTGGDWECPIPGAALRVPQPTGAALLAGGHLLLHTSNPGKQPSVWSSSDEKKKKGKRGEKTITRPQLVLLSSLT